MGMIGGSILARGIYTSCGICKTFCEWISTKPARDDFMNVHAISKSWLITWREDIASFDSVLTLIGSCPSAFFAGA